MLTPCVSLLSLLLLPQPSPPFCWFVLGIAWADIEKWVMSTAAAFVEQRRGLLACDVFYYYVALFFLL
jgi:hypothetical protein